MTGRRSQRRPRSSLLVAVSAVLAVVLTAGSQLLYPPDLFDPVAAVVLTLAVASLAGVGAFLVLRVPANRVSWLLYAAGILLALAVFTGAYSVAGIAASGDLSAAVVIAAWLSNTLYIVPIVIVVGGVPAVFPDGHLPSPRWRWLPALLVFGTTLAVLSPALMPGPLNDSTIQNPFGVPALAPLLTLAASLATLTAGPAFVASFAALATRFRRGTRVERKQVKWLLAAASVGAIGFPVAFLLPGTLAGNVFFFIGMTGLISLPVAIGVAILRYRLYEIDRIVSRTIGWAIVTAVLITAFAVLVVGLQALLAPVTNENTLAVAMSTLVAAALFQPVRARVQRAVDRRFNRSHVDAQRTVDEFGHRLRDEIDLVSLRDNLIGATRGSVQPDGAALWIRAAGR